MSDKKRFLIRLSNSLREKLEAIAEQENRTLTDCMNHALTCYVDKYEEINNINLSAIPKKEASQKEMLQIRVDCILAEKVKKLAKENHRNVSSYLRNFFEEYVSIEEENDSIIKLPKKEADKKEILQTGVNVELAERIKVLAKKNRRSVSSYLEIILEKHISIEEESREEDE